jgi:hypothetical protein
MRYSGVGLEVAGVEVVRRKKRGRERKRKDRRGRECREEEEEVGVGGG